MWHFEHRVVTLWGSTFFFKTYDLRFAWSKTISLLAKRLLEENSERNADHNSSAEVDEYEAASNKRYWKERGYDCGQFSRQLQQISFLSALRPSRPWENCEVQDSQIQLDSVFNYPNSWEECCNSPSRTIEATHDLARDWQWVLWVTVWPRYGCMGYLSTIWTLER